MKQINWKKVTPKSLAAIIRKKLQESEISKNAPFKFLYSNE